MDFVDRVRQHIQEWGYRPTEFGRLALGDPNFIKLLFSGKRNPGLRVVQRVEAWMALGPKVHDIKWRHPPPRRGHQWTKAEDAKLRSLVKRLGYAWSQIGPEFGVSRHAAKRRAIKLGIWPSLEAKDEEAA